MWGEGHVLFTLNRACEIITPWGLKPLRCNLTHAVNRVLISTVNVIYPPISFIKTRRKANLT